MHAEIAVRQAALGELCRVHHVIRLEVFGSAARGTDFHTADSDADFLVTFAPTHSNDLSAFQDFRDALALLLERPVDLLEREAIEESRNHIRRHRILSEAQPVYG